MLLFLKLSGNVKFWCFRAAQCWISADLTQYLGNCIPECKMSEEKKKSTQLPKRAPIHREHHRMELARHILYFTNC